MHSAESAHAELARLKKAEALSDFLVSRYRERFQEQLDVETFISAVEQQDEAWWVDVAKCAKVNPPSETTRNLVIAILRQRHEADLEAARDGGSPLPSDEIEPQGSPAASEGVAGSVHAPVQSSLLDLPRVGRMHRDASETERQAAIAIAPTTGSQRGRILSYLRTRGDKGAIRSDIERDLKLPTQSVTARLNELMRDGWIEKTSLSRFEPSTRMKQTVWRAKRAVAS